MGDEERWGGKVGEDERKMETELKKERKVVTGGGNYIK